MREALYLIGASGAGKTTLMQAITRDMAYEQRAVPVKHVRYENGVVQLGEERGMFSGTDAMPLNANTNAMRFVRRLRAPVLLGEGDRLANGKFFDALEAAGWTLTVVYLDIDYDTSEARWRARGSDYGHSWARGRWSKARNLAERYSDRVFRLDAREPTWVQMTKLRGHPAVERARARPVDHEGR